MTDAQQVKEPARRQASGMSVLSGQTRPTASNSEYKNTVNRELSSPWELETFKFSGHFKISVKPGGSSGSFKNVINIPRRWKFSVLMKIPFPLQRNKLITASSRGHPY